ncbi:uncharacterized protein LOC119666181 [Teleopsis dalmanni]|uniref:uncharacterized protein LOC119666181 n=1 Tax=Teleopsis dalmanni TaxID=139649 RepID=UPI0018CE3DFE|nr:uncharacterized protein LOC119666181 [Teleopsis dalmanni]
MGSSMSRLSTLTAFRALPNLLGTERVRTTPYHPAANGMIERFHRTSKTALMARPEQTWLQLLPSVLLGLRSALKEDIGTSAAQLASGTVPSCSHVPSCSQGKFLDQIRKELQQLRPTSASHHLKSPISIHKGLRDCTHVFLRSDHIRKPLEPPYTGPHKIIKRISERIFKIQVGIKQLNVSIERLKPAFIAESNEQSSEPSFLEILVNPAQNNQKDRTSNNVRKVIFAEQDPLR